MTESKDYSGLVAKVIARKALPPRSAVSDRDRGIGVVAHAMAGAARRQNRRRRLVFAAGALAALVVVGLGAVGLGFTSASSHPVSRPNMGHSASTDLVGRSGGAVYPPGSRIVAHREPLTVRFGPVTRLELEKDTELAYENAGPTRLFRLLRGATVVSVARLSPGQRFVVATPDAEVEVHGTTFEVAVTGRAQHCPSQTSVRVREGRVIVRTRDRTLVLDPGQSFEPPCSSAELEPVAPVAAPIPSVAIAPAQNRASARSFAGARSGSAPGDHTPPAPSGPTESTAAPPEALHASRLSAQNELYAHALTARSAGQWGRAIGLLERLMTEFPESPLIESALVERLRLLRRIDRPRAEQEAARYLARLLRRIDRPRAEQEAARYLARFPRGFGREEAEALLEP